MAGVEYVEGGVHVAGSINSAPQLSGSLVPSGSHVTEFETTVLAHAEYFSGLLNAHGPTLFGAGQPDGGRGQMAAMRLLKLELDNLLEALDTALRRERSDL